MLRFSMMMVSIVWGGGASVWAVRRLSGWAVSNATTPTAQPPLRPHSVNSLAQPVGGVDCRIVPRGEIERCSNAPGELPRPPRLHLVAPAHRVRPERTAQARHRRVGGNRVAE